MEKLTCYKLNFEKKIKHFKIGGPSFNRKPCLMLQLLGSKDLDLNILNHICIVLANQEQNMSSLCF